MPPEKAVFIDTKIQDDMINHVMQTAKDKNIPDHWMESYYAYNALPGIDYRLMTDEDIMLFMMTHFPQYIDKFLALEYAIQRVDVFRVAYIYKYGGIYSDLDIVPQKDIRKYLQNGEFFVLPSANVPSVFTNAFFAARHPGNKFLGDLLEHMDGSTEWWQLDKHQKVMHSTGPNMFTKFLTSGNYEYTVLPYKLIQPYSICDNQHDKDSVLDIVEGSSWMDEGTKNIYHNSFCLVQQENQWMLVILIIGIFLILLLFLCYYVYKRITSTDK